MMYYLPTINTKNWKAFKVVMYDIFLLFYFYFSVCYISSIILAQFKSIDIVILECIFRKKCTIFRYIIF